MIIDYWIDITRWTSKRDSSWIVRWCCSHEHMEQPLATCLWPGHFNLYIVMVRSSVYKSRWDLINFWPKLHSLGYTNIFITNKIRSGGLDIHTLKLYNKHTDQPATWNTDGLATRRWTTIFSSCTLARSVFLVAFRFSCCRMIGVIKFH